jgi:hypothetical protein
LLRRIRILGLRRKAGRQGTSGQEQHPQNARMTCVLPIEAGRLPPLDFNMGAQAPLRKRAAPICAMCCRNLLLTLARS